MSSELKALDINLNNDSILIDDRVDLFNKRRGILKQIAPITDFQRELTNIIDMIQLCHDSGDFEMIKELQEELGKLHNKITKFEFESLFSNKEDKMSCFLEIHSGAGGIDSDDWAALLLRMYMRWSEKHGYKVEVIDRLDGSEGGIKSVTIKINGLNAYGYLKTESGIHRLVRISPFNSAKKRHTSFASVYVYQVIDDTIKVDVREIDLKIETRRSSGAGGQHVNTTDSAVRITHLPTKIVVQSQSNRSQHQNKAECMSVLKAKLYQLALQEQEAAVRNNNKVEIGWGNQIRSYCMHPYKLVKDVRTGYEENNVDNVLDGELDEFIMSVLKSGI